MWENVVTPKVKNDLSDFWTRYREKHGIGKNIVLLAVDVDRSLTLELGRVMNLFVDEVLSQRQRNYDEYEGESALQMKDEDKEDE